MSHTFLYIRGAILGVDMVLQSSDDMGGFHFVSYESFRKKNKTVAAFDLGTSANVGIQKMVVQLGRRYDYMGLFGMAWVLVGRWLKRKWKNPLQSSKALTCAEAVVIVLQESGFPGAGGLDPSSMTPQDILEFVSQHYPEMRR